MADGDTDPAIQSSGNESDAPATILPLPNDKPAKGRKGRQAEPETTQAEPTAPRARDPETGLELDEHGLPLSGPARRQWLADAGIEDPALKVADETENPDG